MVSVGKYVYWSISHFVAIIVQPDSVRVVDGALETAYSTVADVPSNGRYGLWFSMVDANLVVGSGQAGVTLGQVLAMQSRRRSAILRRMYVAEVPRVVSVDRHPHLSMGQKRNIAYTRRAANKRNQARQGLFCPQPPLRWAHPVINDMLFETDIQFGFPN